MDTRRLVGPLVALMVTFALLVAPVDDGAATASPRARPALLSSGSVRWGGAVWRAVAAQPSGYGTVTVTVSRESGTAWHRQGQVRLNSAGTLPQSGDLGARGDALYAAGLTGVTTPDFVLVTEDLGSEPWFSVISASRGPWHLVPVDFGYGRLTGVPAAVKVDGHLLRVEVGGGVDSNTPTAVDWYRFSDGAFSITNPPGRTPPCDSNELPSVPLPDGQGSEAPSGYDCLDGWALSTGTYQMSPYLDLANWQGSSGWQDIAQYVGPDLNLDDAPMWYGIPLGLLQGLGKAVGATVAPDVAAASVLSRFQGATVAGYDDLSVVVDSGVLRQNNRDWLAVATSLGVGVSVEVFAWNGTSWSRTGTVNIGYFGQLEDAPEGGGLVPEALTGLSAPDFALNGIGADTHWFAVISDIGGRWRGVPFDWVGKPTVAVSGGNVQGSLVEGELDACGCASGPESSIWYRYSQARREFVPTDPPGLPAPCSAAAAHQTVTVADITFDRVACVDGWAIGAGTETSHLKVVVLMEQQGTTWQAVNLADAPVLGRRLLSRLTAEYLVPPDVLDEIVTGLGVTAG
ncbi:MAG: hypothetical protein ABSB52_01110 [Acidimicrobiales bacterium]